MQCNFVPRVRVFGPNNERFCGYHNKKKLQGISLNQLQSVVERVPEPPHQSRYLHFQHPVELLELFLG